MNKTTKSRIRPAPAQEIIIDAIADDFPHRLHDRDSLLRSPALDREIKSRGPAGKTRQEAVKRSLGRVRHGPVREVLLLDRNHPRIRLPEIGIVAVSISIVSLNAEHEAWLKSNGSDWKVAHQAWRRDMKAREPVPPSPEPTQELILRRIIEGSKNWIREELPRRSDGEGLRLLILDASIVHGSGSFDILLTVLYRQLDHFTRFIREVVQRTQHVNSTQTLQVPYRIGLPNTPSGS